MSGTRYDLPAMPIWMGIEDMKHRSRMEKAEIAQRDQNPCPVCGKKATRIGSDRYKEMIQCDCGAIY